MSEKYNTLTHTVAPVYDENSQILILGTFPSPKSREYGFFYGHPQNRFWRVLAAVYGAPVPETTDEKKRFLLKNRIALWDVVKSCEIMGASDNSIRNVEVNDFGEILKASQIKAVFTTGKKATELYAKHCAEKTGITSVYLPSTSPANAGMSFDGLVDAYSDLHFICPKRKAKPRTI